MPFRWSGNLLLSSPAATFPLLLLLASKQPRKIPCFAYLQIFCDLIPPYTVVSLFAMDHFNISLWSRAFLAISFDNTLKNFFIWQFSVWVCWLFFFKCPHTCFLYHWYPLWWYSQISFWNKNKLSLLSTEAAIMDLMRLKNWRVRNNSKSSRVNWTCLAIFFSHPLNSHWLNTYYVLPHPNTDLN